MATVKYLGDGTEHFFFAPSRDMSEEEFDALTEDQKHLVYASSIYEVKGWKPSANKELPLLQTPEQEALWRADQEAMASVPEMAKAPPPAMPSSPKPVEALTAEASAGA